MIEKNVTAHLQVFFNVYLFILGMVTCAFVIMEQPVPMVQHSTIAIKHVSFFFNFCNYITPILCYYSCNYICLNVSYVAECSEMPEKVAEGKKSPSCLSFRKTRRSKSALFELQYCIHFIFI